MDQECLEEHVNMEETPTVRGRHSHIELASMQPTTTMASTWCVNSKNKMGGTIKFEV
jgi:hypothetical protein